MTRRVLSVVHGPVYGGAHSQMIRLERPLRERGFETVALVPTEPGSARPRLEAAGVDVAALPLRRLRATVDPATHARFALGLPREVQAIRRLIRERAIDVVQVHGPTNPHAAIAGRLEGIGVVWQLYEMRTPMSLRRATMPVVVRLADVLMTTGREVARLHPGALAKPDRLVTYVPPVDAGEFRPDPDRREAARAELGVPNGAPLVGTLGNLNPDKGHEFLVRAAALLRGERPELRVCVLGAHSAAHAAYEAGVRQEARALGLEEGDAIRFMDPGDRASELLPAFDVFVLASRWEGIPTAVLEAMACGVPVVTTDVGAVREVVEDGVSALVVPPRDPAAIADAVKRVLDDPTLARELSAAGPRAMAGRFGLERCVDAHVRAYRMAIAAREEPGAVAVPVGVE